MDSGTAQERQAQDLGPEVLSSVTRRLEANALPEQVYRVYLGLLNLNRQYPTQRREAARKIANREGLVCLKQIKSILQSQRDRLPEPATVQVELPQDHCNIRGPWHFH